MPLNRNEGYLTEQWTINECVQFHYIATGFVNFELGTHGLRTPNEGINFKNLKIWADVADKTCFGRTLKIWEWIFGYSGKTISSLGARSS